MKHDVKLKYDLDESQIAEMLNSGYKLIGFSIQESTGYVIPSHHYVFSKEIDDGF